MSIAVLTAGFVIMAGFIQCKKGPEAGGSASAAAPDRAAAGPGTPDDTKVPAAASRSVVINGQRLSDQTIEALERAFRVRVKDGEYWYDRMNGSWGVQGGPAAGFIMAGLDLGGPLRPDASNGNTGVFINGRQLHQVDVARLSLLGPIYPGRYWMDAMGNCGFEGLPAILNIWVLAQSLGGGGGRREGILSTYDKTGMAVIGY